MTELYLYLFIAICLSLLIWGLAKSERIYQYPFFMGGIFVAFVVPQAVALINRPYAATPSSVERVLLMACLCAGMCWLGYQFTPKIKSTDADTKNINESRLFKIGIVLAVIGNFFNYLVLTTTPQIAENSNWTGPITIYVFFANTSSIAFAILLTFAIRKFSFTRLLLTLFAAYPLLIMIFGAGRRQKTATFFIVIGIILFFERRISPPRWLALALVTITVLLIPLAGMLREDLWTTLLHDGISAVDWTDGLDKVLAGNVLELRNAALLIEAVAYTDKYGLGTGYWDGLIFQFVPGQIVGKELKQSLQINLTDYDLRLLFKYQIPRGSTRTGIGDAFMEFGYFGCLFFALQAHFFKRLWFSATLENDPISRILYAGLISSALVGVTHGTIRFIQELVFQWGIILIVFWYAKERPKYIWPYYHTNKRLSMQKTRLARLEVSGASKSLRYPERANPKLVEFRSRNGQTTESEGI